MDSVAGRVSFQYPFNALAEGICRKALTRLRFVLVWLKEVAVGLGLCDFHVNVVAFDFHLMHRRRLGGRHR